MPYLVAALALVGAIASLNLLLTVGVVRRLREHTTRLAQLTTGGFGAPRELIRQPGERPDEFTATTVDGDEVTLTSLHRPTMVGFFSPGCGPCKEWLPKFAAAASAQPAGPAQALAVIATSPAGADHGNPAEDLARLKGVARVVVEPYDGPVSAAFGVKGWPALCQLGEDGTITTSDSNVVVAAPVPA